MKNNKNLDTLTDDQKKLVTYIINRLSTGGHPMAQYDKLQYFVEKYVIKLLNRSLKNKAFSQTAKDEIENILRILAQE